MERELKIGILFLLMGVILVIVCIIGLIFFFNEMIERYQSFCESKGGEYNKGICLYKENGVYQGYNIVELDDELILVKK